MEGKNIVLFIVIFLITFAIGLWFFSRFITDKLGFILPI